MLILTGCSSGQIDTSPNILIPQNFKIPLEGKWKLDKRISCLNAKDETDDEDWTGKIVQLDKIGALIGDYFYKNPSYKIKKVNFDEYCTYRLEISKETLGINGKDVYVVTLTSGDKFLYEFVEINDKELLIQIKNSIYILKKISSRVDKDFDKNKKEIYADNSVSDKNSDSGILLGIRSENMDADGSKSYSYKTVWIAFSNNELHPLLEKDNLIFLPRKSGFWDVKVNAVSAKSRQEDIITAKSETSNNVLKQAAPVLDPAKWKDKVGKITKCINYIGNDFLSLEIEGTGKDISTGEKWYEEIYQTQPVDNLNTLKGLSISDIAGSSAPSILLDDRSNALKQINADKIINSDFERNFSLVRSVGHWHIRGGINYIQNNTERFIDYSVNIIPSSKIVFYDNLNIPWTAIKDRLPEALDAYTSPDGQLAIILSQSRLYIYRIEKGSLSSSPIEKVSLNEDDKVIMAEWATGSYVKTWENDFMKNNPVKVDAIK